MGPNWVFSAPDGPHVAPINLAIWVAYLWRQTGNFARSTRNTVNSPWWKRRPGCNGDTLPLWPSMCPDPWRWLNIEKIRNVLWSHMYTKVNSWLCFISSSGVAHYLWLLKSNQKLQDYPKSKLYKRSWTLPFNHIHLTGRTCFGKRKEIGEATWGSSQYKDVLSV